jgi:hypothetical protein
MGLVIVWSELRKHRRERQTGKVKSAVSGYRSMIHGVRGNGPRRSGCQNDVSLVCLAEEPILARGKQLRLDATDHSGKDEKGCRDHVCKRDDDEAPASERKMRGGKEVETYVQLVE